MSTKIVSMNFCVIWEIHFFPSSHKKSNCSASSGYAMEKLVKSLGRSAHRGGGVGSCDPSPSSSHPSPPIPSDLHVSPRLARSLHQCLSPSLRLPAFFPFPFPFPTPVYSASSLRRSHLLQLSISFELQNCCQFPLALEGNSAFHEIESCGS